MLSPRIIPCLLVKDKGLVKTVKFKAPKYVGDPLNAVRIFNEKEVDELVVLDITATSSGLEPDYRLIGKMAIECRMPLCYGGGVRTANQAKRIIGLGVEKIAISAEAIANPSLISDIAAELGSQSIVVIMDVKKKLFGNRYEIFTHNGKKSTGKCPIKFAELVEQLGAGEVIINSIDRDGVMKGYDFDLIKKVRDVIALPLTTLGGVGSRQDIIDLIKQFGIIGAAAGSLFVFKGPYKAVLINYPKAEEKNDMINHCFQDQ